VQLKQIVSYICCTGKITMKLLIITGTFLLSVGSLLAQSGEEEFIRLKQEAGEAVTEGTADENPGEVQTSRLKPGHWDFSVGTSYSYMKGYGSGMMFYTVPSYTISLSDRWSLHGGIMASRYQGLNYTQPGENLLPGSYSSLAVFGAASYRMSDRLILHGAGVKQLLSAPVTPFTPYPIDDLSLGATYRIGQKATIGVSVHMRNNNGYYSSPYLNPFSPTPFGW
jgi:hypothetical protein